MKLNLPLFVYSANQKTNAKNLKTVSVSNAQSASPLKCELPSYGFSFGMAKINSSKNFPQCTFSYENLTSINDYYCNYNTEDYTTTKPINLNYRKTPEEMLHYLKGKNINLNYDKLFPHYIGNFLDGVKLIQDKDIKNSVLQDIAETKDENGQTLFYSILHNAICADETKRDVYIKDAEKMIELCKDNPELMYTILMHATPQDKPHVSRLIHNNIFSALDSLYCETNKIIYNLATKEEKISEEESYNLLKEYFEAGILNDTNKIVYAMYENEIMPEIRKNEE